ncbi:MAG TPA: anthranilate synthase component I family protein [Thermoanaerobaculia bacterium]|nr:anthranilate synthase component I family protein [Thermoanaerobaculia bacterium]
MPSPFVLLRGPGWKLPEPLELRDPIEVLDVKAERPDELPALLERLDAVARSGRPELLAAGFLTYEAGVALEGSTGLFRPPPTPLAWFGLFDLRKAAEPGGPGPARSERPAPTARPFGPHSETTPEEWFAAVEGVRAGIARGDVYQANLTRRVVRELPVPARRLADLLYADNAVPYALLADTGAVAVVSNSPELFLEADLATGRVASAPIKGTVARTAGGSEEAARALLVSSEKDAAEHLMIVDLVRNDLGRVCRPGSVHVPALRSVKSYRHLHHLESTVAGTLAPGASLSDLLLATLPAGSITGAPKRSALGFIRRLEPAPRGPYTGAAGFVRGDGTAVLNVAIRTAIVSAGAVAYHAGGGIVWDSDPRQEWEESETKSREFFRALAVAAGESEVR